MIVYALKKRPPKFGGRFSLKTLPVYSLLITHYSSYVPAREIIHITIFNNYHF